MLKKIALAVSLGLAAGSAALAQTSVDLGGLTVDRSAAVEVAADTLSVDQATGEAVFSGSVVIAQGDLKISAARVAVLYDDATGDIASLTASGGVTFVTATEAAEAQSAVYSLTDETVTLTGDVLLTQAQSAIAAEKMVINVATGSAVVSGRVRTVLQQGGN